jgi:hypothetical protein
MFLTFIQQIIDIGGSGLLSRYNGSPSLLLSSVYPDYDWLPWKFSICPRNYWNDLTNQRKFMEWATKELNIEKMGDWYRTSFKVT